MTCSGTLTVQLGCAPDVPAFQTLHPVGHCQRAMPSVGHAAPQGNSAQQLASTTNGVTLPCSCCNLKVTASRASPQLECCSGCSQLRVVAEQLTAHMQVLQCQDSTSQACQQLEGLLSMQCPSRTQSSRLLTCRCCNLDISASDASQELEVLLQQATTRETEQQHRQQGSILRVRNEPPPE